MFVLLVYPYIKGEKIHNDIHCGKEIINKIHEFKSKNGELPTHLSFIENSECSKTLKHNYEIVSMKEYNSNIKKYSNNIDSLKEDSFYLRLYIEEYTPLRILYSDRRKEFLLED